MPGGHETPPPAGRAASVTCTVRLAVRYRGAVVLVVLPAASVNALVDGLAPGTSVEPTDDSVAAHARLSMSRDPQTGFWQVEGGQHAGGGTYETTAQADRALSSEVHLAIATHAPDDVFVHAGVVSWHGQAIVIPGRSMSGKTTLVRALLAQGAGYMSDEYAVIDPTGGVRPYARPLSVRGAGGPTRVAPDGLGTVETGQFPIGVVVVTHHDPNAIWKPTRRTTAAVVLPLTDNAVAAQVAPSRVLNHLTEVARTRPLMLTGPRGNATDAAQAILAEAEQPRAKLRSHEKTKPSSARRVGQTLHRQSPAGGFDRPATDHSRGGP